MTNGANKDLISSKAKDVHGVKVKALFFISSLDGGGAERVMTEILRTVDRKKIDPILVLLYDYKLSPYKENLPEEMKVIVNKRASDRPLDKIRQLADFIKTVFDEKPHVILSMLTHCNIMSVCAKLIFRKKVIICEHNTLGEVMKTEEGSRMLWFSTKHLVKLLYRFADKIIAVSEGIKANLIEEFNIPSGNIEILYNPIDPERIAELCKITAEHVYFKNKVPVIISAGRLVPQKGFDILIKAFSRVLREMEAGLIILGEGPEMNSLTKQVKDLAITEKVSFLGFQENPFKFISKADIFVLSSRYEGLPMVMLEAMACGTPVISMDCKSGPSEILQNGRYGMLVPPEDIEALSSTILKLLKDRAQRESLSHLGKQRVKDFSLSKTVWKYEEIICKSVLS